MHSKSILSTTKIHIPWWLTIIIILETLPMFVGPYVALTNPPFLGGQGAEELNQAAFIYTARNLAVGFAFSPLALVHVTVCVNQPSMAVSLVIVPVANVLGAVGPQEDTCSIATAVSTELSNVSPQAVPNNGLFQVVTGFQNELA